MAAFAAALPAAMVGPLAVSFMVAVGLAAVTLWPAGTVGAAAPPAAPQGEPQAETPPAPGDEGPLVAEGPQADLALIYTGGVVGYVEPCG